MISKRPINCSLNCFGLYTIFLSTRLEGVQRFMRFSKLVRKKSYVCVEYWVVVAASTGKFRRTSMFMRKTEDSKAGKCKLFRVWMKRRRNKIHRVNATVSLFWSGEYRIKHANVFLGDSGSIFLRLSIEFTKRKKLVKNTQETLGEFSLIYEILYQPNFPPFIGF